MQIQQHQQQPSTVTTTPPPPRPEILTHDGKAYRRVLAGPWAGVQRILTETSPKPPVHAWTGARMPMSLALQILAFLEWSQETTHSETVVHLFHHTERGEWTALVLPQRGHQGLHVNLIDDHPERIPTFQRLPDQGRGWSEMGSWHHHCSSGAFQSGTDAADEVSKEGLHITTGNLGAKKYSIHARASFRHTVTPTALADWIETPIELLPAIAMGLLDHEKAVETMLCRPTSVGATFPEWWRENVIYQAPVQPAQQPTQFANSGGGTGGYGFGSITIVSDEPFLPGEKYWDRQERLKREQERREAKEEWCTDVDAILCDNGLEPEKLVGYLKAIDEYPVLANLIHACVVYGVPAEEAIAELQEWERQEKGYVSPSGGTTQDGEAGVLAIDGDTAQQEYDEEQQRAWAEFTGGGGSDL